MHKDLLLYDDDDTAFATLLTNTIPFLLCYVLYNEETDGCNVDAKCNVTNLRLQFQ